MRKNLGQVIFSIVSIFLSFNIAHGSIIPETRKTPVYAVLKPFFEAIGYRPLRVHVFDEATGIPIPEAVVMLGEGEHHPFNNNWLRTDESGNATFDGFALPKGSQTISVRHPDYSGCTIFQTEADVVRVPVSRLEKEKREVTVKGRFTGWPPMADSDGIVHMGILLPFADIISFVNFSADKFLAPFVKAHIYKEVRVPGNLVLPTQEEQYLGLLPVHISKPTYQMPFAPASRQNLMALSGEIPFSDLVSAMINKKPFTHLLNLISLTQFGMVRDHEIPETAAWLNIELSHPISPKLRVRATHFPDDKDAIFLSLGTFSNAPNLFFPLDFKSSARTELSKAAHIKSIADKATWQTVKNLVMVLAADLPKYAGDEKKLDTAIAGAIARPRTDQTEVVFQTFLGLFDLYRDQEEGKLFSYKIRNDTEDPLPHLNISFLNFVVPSTKEKLGSQRTWWTIIAPAGMDRFSLPELPEGLSQMPSLQPGESVEWTLNRLKFQKDDASFNYDDFNQAVISDALTHFSRNHLRYMP